MFLLLGLRQHKPIRTKPEGITRLRLVCLVFDAIVLSGLLERHRHAEGDSSFSFADLPFAFEPSAIGVEGSGLQVAPNALFKRKQRIPEAIVVKCSVGSSSRPGFSTAIRSSSPQVACCFSDIRLFLSSFPFQAWFALEKKKAMLFVAEEGACPAAPSRAPKCGVHWSGAEALDGRSERIRRRV